MTWALWLLQLIVQRQFLGHRIAMGNPNRAQWSCCVEEKHRVQEGQGSYNLWSRTWEKRKLLRERHELWSIEGYLWLRTNLCLNETKLLTKARERTTGKHKAPQFLKPTQTWESFVFPLCTVERPHNWVEFSEMYCLSSGDKLAID